MKHLLQALGATHLRPELLSKYPVFSLIQSFIIVIGIRAVLLTDYCVGGEIEKNEMGGACGAYGGGVVHRVLVGKPEGRRPLGKPRRRWEDNIKMDLQEVGGGSKNAGNFLTSCRTS